MSTAQSWKTIMMNDLCGCCSDCGSCCMSWICPLCLAGSNQEKIGNSCFVSCICYPCCAGCQRSNIQNALGVPDNGCCMNCCIHIFCGLCARAQEARALNAWILAGKPAPLPGAQAM